MALLLGLSNTDTPIASSAACPRLVVDQRIACRRRRTTRATSTVRGGWTGSSQMCAAVGGSPARRILRGCGRRSDLSSVGPGAGRARTLPSSGRASAGRPGMSGPPPVVPAAIASASDPYVQRMAGPTVLANEVWSIQTSRSGRMSTNPRGWLHTASSGGCHVHSV